MSKEASVIRIKPFFYIHVLDNNSNVTRVEVGPTTFTRQEHEKVVFGPEEMIKIPPRHYVTISNPIVRNPNPCFDEHGNPELRFGDEEIRFEKTIGEPFPLYPGESLNGKVTSLPYVPANNAIRLRAIRNCVDSHKKERKAGEEWIVHGPITYYPQVEVSVVKNVVATIIKENEAIRLRAKKAMVDRQGNSRKTGEEWLVRESGAYIPDVDEEIVQVDGKTVVKAIVLTEKKALQLAATKSYTDVYGKHRKAGQEWLVTLQDSSTHLPDIYEQVVREVKITTLSNRQYCVVLDPVGKDGHNQLGQKELRVGETSFFLQPGETLENNIQNIHVLGEEEALLLTCQHAFTDTSSGKEGVQRQPGERWMLTGPTDYVPPVEVQIIEKRKRIPLDENEGIYVRDLKTGKVRSVSGQSYLLEPHEVLWEKPVPSSVEELLSKAGQERVRSQSKEPARDKTRLVTYRAPHNSAVQVYDFKKKQSRVVFGPGLVTLEPDEQFTQLSLSGGTPKKEGVTKTICLLLGPDFMTDVVTVETSDHARLALQLAYNWHFSINREAPDAYKIFQVPDFVGDACKAIASRVRGSVAACTFDFFHRNSAEIIRSSVFGKDQEGNIRSKLQFNTNSLVITGIDIQSVEPVDERTRDSLQKSVQLAIEITTSSQEAEARRESEKLAQQAKGQLELQRISNEVNNEKARKNLLTLQAQSANVEATGQSIAEAQAKADALAIEAEANVKQAQLKAEASRIQSEAELEQLNSQNQAEVSHLRDLNALEVSKAKEMSAIEAKKFKQIVDSLGADTIQSMAQAGPELQAKLLNGLGLKSFMITDGNSPINLFNTANGILGGPNVH